MILIKTAPQRICRFIVGLFCATQQGLLGTVRSVDCRSDTLLEGAGKELINLGNVFGLFVSRQAVNKSLPIALLQQAVVQKGEHAAIFHRANQAAKTLLQRDHSRRDLILKESIAAGGIYRADSRRDYRIVGHGKMAIGR